jgi:hypothetical protein
LRNSSKATIGQPHNHIVEELRMVVALDTAGSVVLVVIGAAASFEQADFPFRFW